MPDSKISALTNHAAAPAAGDLFVIVDVSDTSMAPTGTDKKLAATYLLNSAGTATGATSQAQTFTNGIISNGQVGINRTPTTALDVYHATSHSLVTIATGSTTANITSGFTISADTTTTSLRTYTAASGGGARTNFTISGGYLLLGTLSADPVNIYAGNAARIVVGATGLTSIGHSATGTAYADVAASTTSAASLRLRSGSAPTTANDGDIWNDGALSYYGANSTTNAVVNHLRLRRDSTGTAAAGFGLGIIAELESSTTNAQSAGRLTWEWATATHASRAAKGRLTAYYTSTEREAITWVANSTDASVGVFASSPDGLQIGATVNETARGVDNVRIGIVTGSPRIILEDATYTQWNIDNFAGGLRFFNPGVVRAAFETNGNIGFGGSSYGSGQGVVFIANVAAGPSGTPTGGGLLYVESGALKFKGSSGTVSTIAPA